MTTYTIHPACAAFPDVAPEEIDALSMDIGRVGLLLPIMTCRGQIIDGKNRLAACEMAGVEPIYKEFTVDGSTEPTEKQIWQYACSMNSRRRHLTTGQRALIAVQMVGTFHGFNQHTEIEGVTVVTSSEAADSLRVSRKAVVEAKSVIAKGSPKLIDAVRSGKVSLNDAYEVLDEPKAMQSKAVQSKQEGRTKSVVEAVERNRALEKHREPVFLPIDVAINEQHKRIESFCRALTKFFADNVPDDPWLDEGQLEIARSQLASCCGAIRVMKANLLCCPICEGKGCARCRDCGYMPKNSYQMAGGQ
jgi:hypothetical protein